MSALWTIASNPRKRKSRKARSPAQRAATARMLAANRARKGPARKARRSRRARRSVAVVSTVRRVARRARRSLTARRSVSPSLRNMGGSVIGLAKAGAIGAGGALAADVVQGFANGFLPASMATKTNADGSPNYLNYAVKAGLTVAIAGLAGRVVSRSTAAQMATGSFTVMAYELLRPLAASVLPASMPLGWYAPGMTFKAGVKPGMGVGQYQRLGQYQSAPRSNISTLRSPNATPENTRRA